MATIGQSTFCLFFDQVNFIVAIVVFEGALHEYLWVNASHAKTGTYHVGHRNRVSTAPKKESAQPWYEVLLSFVQSVWALFAGLARWIWHLIEESIELTMMVFDESELFHDLMLRLDVCDGPYHIDMG